MKHFNFLIATDYSKAVMNAERYAVRLAKETGSTLTFLHVYQVPITLPSQPMEFAADAEALHKSHLTKLEQHKNELFHSLKINLNDVPGECIVCEGSAGKQINKIAAECQSDFIIAGTHGASGFQEALLGSHTWDVIRESTVPVLAIPEHTLYTGIQKIVFGTSYREEEIPVLNFLANFASLFHADLTVLHVTNYVLSKEFERKLFEKFRNNIEQLVRYPNVQMRLSVNDSVEEGLNLYCENNKIDLLVMSIPKMSLFEKLFVPNLSMARKMSFHTHTPLLTIPASQKEVVIKEIDYQPINAERPEYI